MLGESWHTGGYAWGWVKIFDTIMITMDRPLHNFSYTQLALLHVYMAAVSVPLVWLDAGILMLTIMFWFVPAMWFWYQEQFSLRHIGAVVAAAIAGAFFWEVAAYSNGIWYEIGSFDIRVFGMFPVEMFFWGFAYLFFILTGYEYFCDDKKTVALEWNKRTVRYALFVLTMIAVPLVYAVTDFVYIPYAYLCLLSLTVLFTVLITIFSKAHTWSVIQKAAVFALLTVPIFILLEYVAMVNVLWVFANPAQYLFTISFAGELVPIEEFMFGLFVPFCTVVIYELCLDDGQ